MVNGISRPRTLLLKVWSRLVASTSYRNLVEMQTLWILPDLQNEILHINKAPRSVVGT